MALFPTVVTDIVIFVTGFDILGHVFGMVGRGGVAWGGVVGGRRRGDPAWVGHGFGAPGAGWGPRRAGAGSVGRSGGHVFCIGLGGATGGRWGPRDIVVTGVVGVVVHGDGGRGVGVLYLFYYGEW